MSDSVQPSGLQSPGSSVRGIFQTRILEWVAISYSRVSSLPRIGPMSLHVSCIAGGFLTTSSTCNRKQRFFSITFLTLRTHKSISFFFFKESTQPGSPSVFHGPWSSSSDPDSGEGTRRGRGTALQKHLPRGGSGQPLSRVRLFASP